MKKIPLPEIILIVTLIIGIVVSAFVLSQSARSEGFQLLGWVRCSNIGIECIDWIYPNRFMCESGKPSTYDCVPVNDMDGEQ